MTPNYRVYWYELAKPEIRPLGEDLSVDAVIVGAGMAGLTAADHLSRAGLSVAIVEKSFAGGGASGKSSGFITPDSELELGDLITRYGKERAKKLWDFVLDGVEEIRKNILEHNLSCDYAPEDSLFIANGGGFDVVKEEHEARLSLGYESRLYDKNTVQKAVGSSGYAGGVRYPGTFGMASYLYCQGMKDVLEKRGVKIFENSPVEHIESGLVRSRGHNIRAKHVIVSADYRASSLGLLEREAYHAQTFLSISKPLEESDIKKIFPDDRLMVWDTDLIYQYYRLTGDNRLLLGAASLLYTYYPKEIPSPQNVLRKMRAYLGEKFPAVPVEIEYFWPGLIGVSKDFLPMAGEDEAQSGVYYISGAAGLPWAAALGKYIAEEITHGRNDFDSDFTAIRSYPVGNTVQSVVTKPVAL